MPYKDAEASKACERRSYAKHREQRIIDTRTWEANNPERVKKYRQEYRESHRSEDAEKHAEYAANNRGIINAIQKKYRQNNRETIREINARTRARNRGAAVIDLSAAQWREIQEAFDHRCAYCGKRHKGKLTKDHVTPYAHNGSHTLWNIVPACKSCNSRKQDGAPPRPVQPLLLTIAKSRKPT